MKFFLSWFFVLGITVVASPIAASTFQSCDSPTPSVKGSKWNHKRSKLVVKLGDPRHVAFDAIVPPGKPTIARAKFVYGGVSKDLQGELVDVFISTCKTTAHLGTVQTDGDGWVAKKVTVPASNNSVRYTMHFVVRGDGSSTSSYVWAVPTSQKLTVFDIDGTLTTNDKEIVGDAWRDYSNKSAAYDAKLRQDAALMTQIVAKDTLPIYLSGRPYWLMNHSRSWLAANKIGPGMLVITQRHRDVPPTTEGVGAFKRDILLGIKRQGYDIVAAYGNAKTDIFAYTESGIPNEKTFILGKHGGKRNTVAVGDSFRKLTQSGSNKRKPSKGRPIRQPSKEFR